MAGDVNGVCLPTVQITAGSPQRDPGVPRPHGHLDSTTDPVNVMDAGPARNVLVATNSTGLGRSSSSHARDRSSTGKD